MATRLVQINMKALDDSALGRFWAEVLGWGIDSEAPGVTNLEPVGFSYPDPSAVYIDLIAHPEPKTVKNRVHLDLATTSAAHQAELIERLTGLGATPVDTWLIQRHVIIRETTGTATVVTEEATNELFAPSLGLSVFRTTRTDVSQADGQVVSQVESVELASTTPR